MCESVVSGHLSIPLSLAVSDIPTEGSIKKDFYLRAHTLPSRNLIVTVRTSSFVFFYLLILLVLIC